MLQTFSGWVCGRFIRFTVIDPRPPISRDLCEAAGEFILRGHSVQFQVRVSPGQWSTMLPVAWAPGTEPNQRIKLTHVLNGQMVERLTIYRAEERARRAAREAYHSKEAKEKRKRERIARAIAAKKERYQNDPEFRVKQAQWQKLSYQRRKAA